MKKLAVLLPTYNAAAYLNESIDSILNQTFTDFDLFVYDDCSSDSTQEIISRYKDSRLFYRKNIENAGIAKTLNKGLEELLPHYEYIARMDADDWSYPERFQKQIDFLEKNLGIVMCGTQGYWLENMHKNPESGWVYPTNHEFIKFYLLFAACFGHSSLIFRSDCLQKNNLRYNELIATCEDWELWVRLVKMGQVANLPFFLMKYRILEGSNHRSFQKASIHFKERSKIISNYWTEFKIVLSPEQVYEYYYGNSKMTKSDFLKKVKVLINIINFLFEYAKQSLVFEERMNFSYMLARRILDFWKRSKVSRYNPIICIMIIKDVKFMKKINFFKSIIRK